MPSDYNIVCINDTHTAYYFGVYYKFPASPGLVSVVWKHVGVPPGGSAEVEWTLNYATVVVNWESSGKRATGKQIVPADIGKSYKCTLVEGDIPSISPDGIPGINPDQISILNDTNEALDLGLGVDQQLVVVSKVRGGETINFDIHPSNYSVYVACYRGVEHGDLFDLDVSLGPVEVKFDNGMTSATVTATTENQKLVLKAKIGE